MSAVETVKRQAEMAARLGNPGFARHLMKIASQGEVAAQANLDETRRLGKAIVDKAMRDVQ